MVEWKNFDHNFDGTCVGNLASKILSKIGLKSFASNIEFFWSSMGPLIVVYFCQFHKNINLLSLNILLAEEELFSC